MTYLSHLLMTSSGHAHLDRQRWHCGMPWSRARCCRKFWGRFLAWSIEAMGMILNYSNSKNPVEGNFGNEFPSICSHCWVMAARSRKTLKKLHFFCIFFWKNEPLPIIISLLHLQSVFIVLCCVPVTILMQANTSCILSVVLPMLNY